MLFYRQQPNTAFTLLSLASQSTSPLFECEMATQVLLNHRGGFANASVYKSKSESASFTNCCHLLPFTSSPLYLPLPLPIHQEDASAAAGGDDAWSESCWELCQQQARGKMEMVIAAVRVGQSCHVLQPLTLLSRAAAHPESADSKPHFPREGMKNTTFLLVNVAYFTHLNFL